MAGVVPNPISNQNGSGYESVNSRTEASTMRFSIDLPEALLDEVQQATNARTRSEALVIALEDYVRRQKRARVVAAAGSMDVDVDGRAVRALGDRRRDP
jgi:Arc/MetJ family transcription regulator